MWIQGCAKSPWRSMCVLIFSITCSVFPSCSPFFPPSNSSRSSSLLKLFFTIRILYYWIYLVHLVLLIYGGDQMMLDNLPVVLSVQKTDSPSLSSYKKSFKQLAWSLVIFTMFILTHQLALILLGFCLMGTVFLSYIDTTISEQMFWTSWLSQSF